MFGEEESSRKEHDSNEKKPAARSRSSPRKKRQMKLASDTDDDDDDFLPSHARKTEKGGFKLSITSRLKMSHARKGTAPWNKGKNRSGSDKAKISAGVVARNEADLRKKLKILGMTEAEWIQKKKEIKRVRERLRNVRKMNETYARNKQEKAEVVDDDAKAEKVDDAMEEAKAELANAVDASSEEETTGGGGDEHRVEMVRPVLRCLFRLDAFGVEAFSFILLTQEDEVEEATEKTKAVRTEPVDVSSEEEETAAGKEEGLNVEMVRSIFRLGAFGVRVFSSFEYFIDTGRRRQRKGCASTTTKQWCKGSDEGASTGARIFYTRYQVAVASV
jgi:NUMOD3 motif